MAGLSAKSGRLTFVRLFLRMSKILTAGRLEQKSSCGISHLFVLPKEQLKADRHNVVSSGAEPEENYMSKESSAEEHSAAELLEDPLEEERVRLVLSEGRKTSYRMRLACQVAASKMERTLDEEDDEFVTVNHETLSAQGSKQ